MLVKGRAVAAAVVVAAMAVSAAGCGGAKDSGGAEKSLTVWFMSGSNPPGWTKDISAAFRHEHPGVKLTVKVQNWDGIQQKLTTALSESAPPDVFEVGNTQTPYYAATGGLKDLGSEKSALGGADWEPSMNASAVYRGKQFAAPWYFADRVVIYNKKIWAHAGITSVPTTQAALFTDLDALRAHGTKDAFYLPGQDWYAFDGFLLDAGADLVSKHGSDYRADLADPKAEAAIELYKKLNSYGTAPKDKDEATPQQSEVFAKGDVGAFLGLSWEANTAISKNKALAHEIGYFPFPGTTAGKPAGVFVGGSNLAVSQGSRDPRLAESFLKLAMSDRFEGELAQQAGVIPNKTSLDGRLAGNAYGTAAAAAAKNGGTTPLIPAWGSVENAPNPITNLFMTPVLEGRSPAEAARTADAAIDQRLNQKQ